MEGNEFVHSEIFTFASKIDYADGGVVSKPTVQRPAGSVTLFAFDQGQELSEHSAPYDALVQLVEGEGEIIIGDKTNLLKAGEAIIMPAGVPHAVKAPKQFKMLLTMIRG